MQMLMQIIVILSWLALPVGLLCIIDDWFLRPRRQLIPAGTAPVGTEGKGGAVAATGPQDPPILGFAYTILPVLIIAVVLRLLLAERLDFSAVLLAIVVVTGLVWLVDALLLRATRAQAAKAAGLEAAVVPEPGTVDYARSFFPVALIVLLLRAFIFEPFRIPSDSMMPTLLAGDFIIVNKYAYGLRLPVVNKKVLATGSPQRGDVVVFRYPRDPSMNYIKRLVGLPGDHVEVKSDRLMINGKPVPFNIVGTYNDGCYVNMQLATEHLGGHVHDALVCPGAPATLNFSETPPSCNRHEARGVICGDMPPAPLFGEPQVVSEVVPPGQYLMIGDNRDNSEDGRVWGFVPEENLVGKATRIWFNWDLHRSGGPIWSRIGSSIP
jgi:signal peptidase I